MSASVLVKCYKKLQKAVLSKYVYSPRYVRRLRVCIVSDEFDEHHIDTFQLLAPLPQSGLVSTTCLPSAVCLYGMWHLSSCENSFLWY